MKKIKIIISVDYSNTNFKQKQIGGKPQIKLL